MVTLLGGKNQTDENRISKSVEEEKKSEKWILKLSHKAKKSFKP
jgi:hypothetical protein